MNDEWAVVELMGHVILAGRITKEKWDESRRLLVIHVPETAERGEWVKKVGLDAIFALTPCSETYGRRAAVILSRTMNGSWTHPARPVHDSCPHGLGEDPTADLDLARALAWDKEQVSQDRIPF